MKNKENDVEKSIVFEVGKCYMSHRGVMLFVEKFEHEDRRDIVCEIVGRIVGVLPNCPRSAYSWVEMPLKAYKAHQKKYDEEEKGFYPPGSAKEYRKFVANCRFSVVDPEECQTLNQLRKAEEKEFMKENPVPAQYLKEAVPKIKVTLARDEAYDHAMSGI